jgi:hypothetical protein|tara:strand:+ start:4190 stop:4768 length:579 start_codon:yes stop_codon:yes gene_type:complete
MKHVGKHGQKPCVVVFRQVPNEPDNCLIVETGTLDEQKHDDLINVVQSLEAQESNNVSEVLARRQFSDGSNMLNDLHFSKKLIKVEVSSVNLTPTPSDSISLTEVNAEISKIEAGSNPPLNTEVAPETMVTPNEVPVVDGDNPAEGLLVQASLLEEDAKALLADADSKRAQAFALDPSLEPKKGPGRPKKTV